MYGFIDLSKAFDHVWHKRLFLNLQSYGISNHLLRWFGSYLNRRSKNVLHRNVISYFKFLHVRVGVPQESVLRPLLFSIYVNDVAKNMSSFVGFTQTTTLYKIVLPI